MCGDSSIRCEVQGIELEEGYQVQITGSKVKEVFSPESLKKVYPGLLLRRNTI